MGNYVFKMFFIIHAGKIKNIIFAPNKNHNMKKLLLVISVSLACCINHNINAQAIPDSSFSVWTHNAGPPAYDDPNPTPLSGDGWQDLNFLSSPLFGSSPVSVFKDSVNFRS